MSLPTGTVTFLFTDLEGSSRLWEKHPQAMGPAMAGHDARLRAAVADNGGHVVKMRGDGLHAVFASASDAVVAAIAGQRELQKATWDEAIGPLRVRMGIHTGTAELRDGDYFGPAVNRAARLQEAGHGEQILLSETAANLVRDQLPDGISLRDLGPHRIKDFPRAERIFQLLAGDLRREFPPLRTIAHVGTNLPAQVTSFIGREREMQEARQLLSQARLLTLTGPGGTGKTRLALQVAAAVGADYREGAWLVELAPLADESMILPAVANAFSLQALPGLPLEEVVKDFLRAKELLLILDNCEHLIEACAALANEFMHAASQVKILASSRESFGVPGEMVLRVPSLSLPEATQAGAEWLRRSEAVQLLVERARAVKPDFELVEENAQAVADICRRLDGIPLAIELAAARLRLFSPQQIADRLKDRFRLLTGGSRTAMPRQQTLQALIDWSYDLLSGDEQELFRRLSVFAGGWTFEAAEGIGEGLDVLELLDNLASKSLIQTEEAGGKARYSYLETIRQYARDRLFAAGEGEETRDRHLFYFVQLAREVGSLLGGPQADDLMDALWLEFDNIRQAIEWGLGRDLDAVVELMAGPVGYWLQIMGRNSGEAREWAIAAMRRMESLPSDERKERAWQRVEAKIHLAAAQSCLTIGDFEKIKEHLERAISLSRAHDDKATLMAALAVVAISEVAAGRVRLPESRHAHAAAEESLALARQLNNGFFRRMAQSLLGSLELVRGNESAGRAMLAEAAESSRFASAISQWRGALAVAQVAQDPTVALPLLQESYHRFEQLNIAFFMAMSKSEIGHIQRRAGDLSGAETSYRETLARFQWMGHRSAVAHQLECFAFIARARQNQERAARLLGAAEALRATLGSEMTAQERVEYDHEVAQLRQGLDVAAFEAAWNAGKAMPMDAAVDHALGEQA